MRDYCERPFRCFRGGDGFGSWSGRSWIIRRRGTMKSWGCCIWMMGILPRLEDVMTGRFRSGRTRWIRFTGEELRRLSWGALPRRYRLWGGGGGQILVMTFIEG